MKDDARELARCLRALAQQTRKPDEIVVVDNGSSDTTSAVAREAGARVERCDVPGIPAAAAHGYDCAREDVVLRLDADCCPATTWVETMAEAFETRPDIAVFTGGARFIDGPRALRVPLAAVYLGAYALVLAPALGHLPLFGSNLGFRRDVWRGIRTSVHSQDAELHDDLDLAYHVGERHRIGYLPQATMGMSMRPFMSGRSFARRAWRGVRTVVRHWPEDFPPVRWVKLALVRALRARRVASRRAA